MSYPIKLMSCSVLCAVIVLVAPDNLRASKKTRDSVTSTYNHGLSISIVNDSEKFEAGRNSFCVMFTKASSAEAAPMKDVVVDFAQQVGKIREGPIHVQIAETDIGYFCGSVDLGKQNYDHAFYYVYIHYLDTYGTRRKSLLSFSIKRE
jgi:hypothetical protein